MERDSSVIPSSTGQITVGEVLSRIRQHAGVDWLSETVDTLKAGDSEMHVTGIATTFMSTLGVLQQSAASGRNLIVTHEPTYYNHFDKTEGLTGDPIYEAKQQFIRGQGLVIWRFHDHWHRRRPDGIMVGLVEALGWREYQRGGDRGADASTPPTTFVLPPTTLEALARHIRDRLGVRVVRVVGNPATPVQVVGMPRGTPARFDPEGMRGVDVILAREVYEWEWVPYAQDAATLGLAKGLIIAGHEALEEAGMGECARWLRTFIPEVPIDHFPSGEPFWLPS